MKHLFFLIVLLSITIIVPNAYAEIYRGLDYSLEHNDGDSYTRVLGLPNYIQDDNGIYQPFIFTETNDFLEVATNHGTVQLDKNTCEYRLFENGKTNRPIYGTYEDYTDGTPTGFENVTPLLTDKLILQMSDNDNAWIELIDVNNASCNPSWNGSELNAKRTGNGVGISEYKYKLNNGKWQTFLEGTNKHNGQSDKKFGFKQVLDLNRDDSFIAGANRNSNANYDKNFLDNNNGKRINFNNGFFFDFDKAYDNLTDIQIDDTGNGKSRLTFDFKDTNILPQNSKVSFDPVFGAFDVNEDRSVIDGGNNGLCDAGSTIVNTTSLTSIWNQSSDTDDCYKSYVEFDISDLPITADVTALTWGYTIQTLFSVEIHDIKQMTGTQPSTIVTASTLFDNIDDAAIYVNDHSISGSSSVSLGATAISDLETAIGISQDWFAVGIEVDDSITQGVSHKGVNLHSSSGTTPTTLTITYNMPPDPPKQFGATIDELVGIDLEWLAGDTNGGSHISYFIERYDAGTWWNVINQVGLTYTHAFPLENKTTMYRVTDVDGLGLGCPQAIMNATIIDNMIFHTPLCYTTNDNGQNNDDATITGNELYDYDSSDVGFDFDDTTYLTVPNESNYDLDYDDPKSFSFWLKATNANLDYLIHKGEVGGNLERYLIYYQSGTIVFLEQALSTGTLQRNSASSNYNSGDWVHVVVTTDGTDCNGVVIYQNGVVDTGACAANTLSSSTLNNQPLIIGANHAGANLFDGQLRDVMLFNSTLTPHDVENIYLERIDTYTLALPPVAINDLTATATTLSSVDLLWSTPVWNFGAIVGYNINYTTPQGNPLTVVVSDTGSLSTAYEVTGLTVSSINSFRVSPVSIYGTNQIGNIANATAFSEFTIGGLTIIDEENLNIFGVLYSQVDTGDASAITVRFPNTVTNMTCNLAYSFAQTDTTYTNLTPLATYDALYDSYTFTLNNSTNEIVDFDCYDADEISVNGQYTKPQSDFPFIQMADLFRDGTFGTDGQFAGMDMITLIVIIVSMVGFNKSNPAAGLIISMMILGATSYFGLITLPTIVMGVLTMLIMLGIVITRK